MLTKSSRVHELFGALASIPSEVLPLGKYTLYDMLRSALEVVSGKADISMFYNLKNTWVPYLKKYYTDKQVNDFEEVLSQVEIEGFDVPQRLVGSAGTDSEEPQEKVPGASTAPTHSTALARAWALGFLTAEMLYKPT